MNQKESMTKPRVAILGLGIMGGGMASRLLSNGYNVAVYNRNPEKAATRRRTRRVDRERLADDDGRLGR